MIENKMEDLLNSIKESSEYQKYQEVTSLLDKNEEVKRLINEIKDLQKKATLLEYQNNQEYKEIDEIIKKKKQELENNPTYHEYLNRMEELNDILSTSTHMIEEYLNEKNIRAIFLDSSFLWYNVYGDNSMENRYRNKDLYDYFLKLKQQNDLSFQINYDQILQVLSQDENSLNLDIFNLFLEIIKHELITISNKLFNPRLDPIYNNFTKAIKLAFSYSCAYQESDQSYTICPIPNYDEIARIIAYHCLKEKKTIKESIFNLNDYITRKRSSLSKGQINDYYGDINYLKERIEAIVNAVFWLEKLNLSKEERMCLTKNKLGLVAVLDSFKIKTNQGINNFSDYLEISNLYKQALAMEEELIPLSKREWESFFQETGARFVHALTNDIVESDQMSKICTTLCTDDMECIPYGHTGYEYGVNMDNIICLCDGDAGSFQMTKEEFIGRGVMTTWQYSNQSDVFFEYGNHTKLLLPQNVVDNTKFINRYSSYLKTNPTHPLSASEFYRTRNFNYNEIVFDNRFRKIKPLRAFYTDKASKEEIAKITLFAQKQNLEVEFIDTSKIRQRMYEEEFYHGR